MGTFNTKTILKADSALLPAIADRICQVFTDEGYEIKRENLISGGEDLSVTKGNMFKAALGMKTALKITLIPVDEGISFEAGVGIFGQQAIPSIISLFIAWPVLLTQIWGLVQQSKLDDKALEAAQSVISEHGNYCDQNGIKGKIPPHFAASTNRSQDYIDDHKFCTQCGNRLPSNAHFCSNCGSRIS